MTIRVSVGNALDFNEPHVFIHGCNNQGVMGSGIAAAVKSRYPDAFAAYVASGYKIGTLSDVEYDLPDPNDGRILQPDFTTKVIVNAVTQYLGLPGRNVSYDAVEACFKSVNQILDRQSAKLDMAVPLIFPAIGAARGGGHWKIIEQIIETSVDPAFPVVLFILDPAVYLNLQTIGTLDS